MKMVNRYLRVGILMLGALWSEVALSSGLFDDIAAAPISSQEVLDRWARHAEKVFCHQPKLFSSPDISVEECIEHVDRAKGVCGAELLEEIPKKVDNKELARQIGRAYIRCILP